MPNIHAARLWPAALALCLGVAVGPAPPEAQEPIIEGGNNEITLNLQNADIGALIASVAELTGKNFIVDPRVKGKVTVISSAATSKDALYDVFLSILKVHGFMAIPSGSVIKIVPDATAKQQAAEDTQGYAERALDELVTIVIPIANVDAGALVPILRPLLPQEAHLAAHLESNVLIVADTAGNIERVRELIAQVDVARSEDEIELITLAHASASSIKETLTQLAQATAGKGKKAAQARIPIIVDERTNSILLTGPMRERLRYRALIAKLDQPITEDETIEVVYLKYANAIDLVPVVQGIFSATPAAPATGQQAGRAPVRRTGARAGFSVQADENTNALIIQGEPDVMRRALTVIAQLDIRRSQVLVEGILAEVSTAAADSIGIQWVTEVPDNDGLFAGSVLPGIIAGPIPLPLAAGEDAGFSTGTGLTLGYFRAGNLRALLRALSTDQYTNVLSTPSIVTLDNAEAEILVGQNVPFITGQFTNNATTPDNPFQTIERQDVGIILRVKPTINEGNTVTMDIEQEISSIDRDSEGSDLITNERSIKTSVLVDDGATIVLGGLITDELRENEQKIPLLGDLPVIGQLFKTSRDDVVKQNLMVFLRPTIMKTPARSEEVADKRVDYMRQKQIEHESRFPDLYPRNKGPLWDEWDGLID